jgi:SpoVK/Ycf46/Vps4 family AAA+-type ATPase
MAMILSQQANLDLYIFSINTKTTDQHLISAVSQIDSSRAILLIEDLEFGRLEQGDHKRRTNNSNYTVTPYYYTFNLNTILNILDGSTSRNGLICCMTTNDEKLYIGKALGRHGRIDRVFKFEECKLDQIRGVVESFMSNKEIKHVDQSVVIEASEALYMVCKSGKATIADIYAFVISCTNMGLKRLNLPSDITETKFQKFLKKRQNLFENDEDEKRTSSHMYM